MFVRLPSSAWPILTRVLFAQGWGDEGGDSSAVSEFTVWRKGGLKLPFPSGASFVFFSARHGPLDMKAARGHLSV